MYTSDLLDQEPSFFDDEKTKRDKNQWKASLSEREREEFETLKEEMEKLPNIGEETSSVDYDEIPHIFDRIKGEEVVVNTLIENPVVQSHMMKKTGVTFHPIPCKNLITVTETEEFSLPPYIYRNGSLLYSPRDEEGVEEVIGNFWVSIDEEIVEVTEVINEQNCVISKEERVFWNITIYCLRETFKATISMGDLFGDKAVLKLTKDRGYLEQTKESKNHYRKYLNAIVEKRQCPTTYRYASTGWMKIANGQWIYLTDIGVLGHPELRIRSSAPYHFAFIPERVGEKQIFDEFYMLKKICPNKPEHSTFLMHYTCLSVLTTLFQEAGHGINFVVALIGSTNSQKTSSALVFTRLFDRTTKATADIRFNSTEVAIMEKMETYGDAILLVDDLLPYEDKRSLSEQMKKSETIIRSYGDRVPRKRSKAYAQINGISEFSRIKGCCLITGEIFDTSSESSLTRVLQLTFERGDVDLEMLSFFQSNLLNVPTFLVDFICFVERNIDMVFEVIKTEVNNARNDAGIDIRTPRFKDTLGIMRAEIMIFYLYVQARGYMAEEEINTNRINDEMLIRKLIMSNDTSTKIKSPATLIFAALKRAVDKNFLYVMPEDECGDMKDFSTIIVEKDDYLMILPEVLWNTYKMYCLESKRDILYKNGRELAAPLRKESAIMVKEEVDGVRSTHKIKAKTGKRFFYIKKSKFKEFYGTYESF